jgi:hypothetical protein
MRAKKKKMQNKFICAWLYLLIFLPVMAFAEGKERDPFMPFAWEKPPAASEAQKAVRGSTSTPLTEDPLSSYTITGIIVSPKDAIILVKSHDKHEYFASVGDGLGSEGGLIDTISSAKVTVDINGKLVNLTVSSRLDIQNENPKSESTKNESAN